MARQKKPEEPPAGAPAWMVSYGDMVTLVLTFFILMFAFSTVDVKKYQQIVNTMRGAMGGNVGVLEQGTSLDMAGEMTSTSNPSYDKVLKQLQKILDQEALKNEVEIRQNGRDITVSFKEKLFFLIGSADILPEALPILNEVGAVISEQHLEIRVEGHTCDIPIRTSKFPSNWELSAIRAVNVTRYLIEKVGLDAKKVSVAGYGQYRPMVPNTSNESRARNRRVDIVLLNAISGQKFNQPTGNVNQGHNDNQNSKGENNGRGEKSQGRTEN
jgi:chemotaxis protein MotB